MYTASYDNRLADSPHLGGEIDADLDELAAQKDFYYVAGSLSKVDFLPLHVHATPEYKPPYRSVRRTLAAVPSNGDSMRPGTTPPGRCTPVSPVK